ncbi:hypothetical protein KCTC52924_01012 [Arenibacter antarcticus]|uniref:Uncharacterized protein n=1 Tax=Arenibacter antarcticus TaxID=2040469 RepID=A0ABW5VB24_9FLAO|nr:hypothetical protein [Arenibacter sp. H213]
MSKKMKEFIKLQSVVIIVYMLVIPFLFSGFNKDKTEEYLHVLEHNGYL